ncbi:hypothetical protein M422DRAFT_252129 [Sphaerobolus stellatus SS14]|uniref:Uncharacterized protein n=1 Tax=Sphaerobolus stellatus (strain SS14) TaxID=990650 RepID=A0A0C9W0T8_SPHS4|nr:hypothetical protein M422DRAFT_252129 [Sphaerobolus stellatus SS14]
MGHKSNSPVPEELHLIPSALCLTRNRYADIDTHTHLISTYQHYQQSYPNTKLQDTLWFIRGLHGKTAWGVETQGVVDMRYEPPVIKVCKDTVDSVIKEEDRAETWVGLIISSLWVH